MYTQVRYSGEFLRFMWLGVPSMLSEVFLIYFTLLYAANTSVSSEVQNARGGGNAQFIRISTFQAHIGRQ